MVSELEVRVAIDSGLVEKGIEPDDRDEIGHKWKTLPLGVTGGARGTTSSRTNDH